jgi:hypothetical protein
MEAKGEAKLNFGPRNPLFARQRHFRVKQGYYMETYNMWINAQVVSYLRCIYASRESIISELHERPKTETVRYLPTLCVK